MTRAIALLATLAVGGCGIAHVGAGALGDGAPVHEYAVERNVVYTPPGWPEALAADVWTPRGPGPFATVVVLHGGGWKRGAPAEMDGIAQALARRGFAAMVPAYRFAPEYRFPAALHDVQQAVRWIRTHAWQRRFDPGRIGAFGYSAGGQLASLLGVIAGHPLDAPYGGPAARVGAVVAGGAPFDLGRYEQTRFIEQWLGASFDADPAVYAMASPINHVTKDDAPMFIYQGSWDAVVPVEMAQAMKTALDVARVPAELFVVAGHGHFTLFLLNDASVTAAIDFLDRHLR